MAELPKYPTQLDDGGSWGSDLEFGPIFLAQAFFYPISR